ncbi:MAG: NADH:flavin oxidoreductase [Muribaculaceae bacterium]|nr:NADH:flavin oxidoreductase [Muribaculaceae bacterium]
METEKMFTPYTLNGKKVKNRFIRSATNDHLGNADGTVSDAEIEMYDVLGRNDVGIIITGHLSVSPDLAYRADEMQLCIGDDSYIEGLQRIPASIHKYDALAIAQISLAGPRGLNPFDFNDLSTKEMEQIRDWFIDAGVRACKAGFDGVQIHVAHWYLLQAVVNTDVNKRVDSYGGSDENCIRLPKEIIEGIRQKCGADFIIMVKMNAHNTESGEDDYGLLAYYCDTIIKAGANLIEISGRDFAKKSRTDSLYYLEAVKYLKEHFPEMPLSLVGGIFSKDTIEAALETADLVSLSRVLLTQPDFITKLRNGELVKSRCLHCNKCFEVFQTKYERCVFGPVLPKLEESFGQ